MKKAIQQLMRRVCTEAEIRTGKCKCEIEAKLGQNNLLPHESTDLICSKRVV